MKKQVPSFDHMARGFDPIEYRMDKKSFWYVFLNIFDNDEGRDF
jgi:hypothetical protein